MSIAELKSQVINCETTETTDIIRGVCVAYDLLLMHESAESRDKIEYTFNINKQL